MYVHIIFGITTVIAICSYYCHKYRPHQSNLRTNGTQEEKMNEENIQTDNNLVEKDKAQKNTTYEPPSYSEVSF